MLTSYFNPHILQVMGNATEFRRAVELVMDYLSFDRATTVQVFEANIRVLGALLSAHLILTDPGQPFGNMRLEKYDGELLQLAHDLAGRLLPAFDNTGTGIPHPRVSLYIASIFVTAGLFYELNHRIHYRWMTCFPSR